MRRIDKFDIKVYGSWNAKKVQSMLSFLNSSTLDSDDEKEKSSIVPKSDLDLYPSNLDENQLLEIEKLTADSLIDLINNVQKAGFP